MSRSPDLIEKIIRFLKKNSGQVQNLAKELKVNRTLLVDYLLALENEKKVKSKRISPLKFILR